MVATTAAKRYQDGMRERLTAYYTNCTAWLRREENRARARELRAEVRKAFTEHPEETGETYLQHLWFTAKMAVRLLYAMTVLLIHGIFPFLLMRAASQQIEIIYSIIKKRIPKSRRDVIDADYSV
jgi:hypothetical protein